MDQVEALAGNDISVNSFDWSKFNRVIDISGSKGSKSIAILREHHLLTALIVDRPQVIAEASTHWHGKEDPSVASRMTFEPRNILERVPKAQSDKDIYMLNAVLHRLDDQSCISVLSNLASACETIRAWITINEVVLPQIGADLIGASFDMQMLIGTKGRERTRAEFSSLFQAVGMLEVEDVKTRSFATMMIVRSAD